MIDRSSYIEKIVSLTSEPLLEKLKKTSVSANNITILGATLGLLGSIIFFFSESLQIKFFAFLMIYLYLVFDFIDGDLARYKNQISDKGYFLDIFFDKIIFIALIIISLSEINLIFSELQMLYFIMAFLPFFFQFNLIIFTNLKKKGVNIVTWSVDNLEEKKISKFILIYRKLFFPTHINIVFLLSLGLFLNLEIFAFCFVAITSLIGIIRQFYIIITKL